MARTLKRHTNRRSRRTARATDRIELTVIVLLFTGAGALLASFWLEWRGETLEAAPAEPVTEAASPVRVEVLNGVGEPGVAGRFRDLLRERGFDVVSAENADHFDYRSTRVIDRSGTPAGATSLAREVGVDSVNADVDPDLFLDATLIIGEDWEERLGWMSEPEAAPVSRGS